MGRRESGEGICGNSFPKNPFNRKERSENQKFSGREDREEEHDHREGSDQDNIIPAGGVELTEEEAEHGCTQGQQEVRGHRNNAFL